ncbi:MAG: hypothetical protein QXU98_08175, partial [Candidatus Parvarchaeota archaeon]
LNEFNSISLIVSRVAHNLAKKKDEKKAKSLNNGHSQKIVSMSEIKQYIERGWEFFQSINSREAIMRIPT